VGAYGVNSYAGAAYIFAKQTNGVWKNGTALTLPSGLSANDFFGSSVALSVDGSTALVGAYGMNNNAGAAYVFVKASGGWSKGTALTLASGPPAYGQFGSSVALSGDGSHALVLANVATGNGRSYAFASYVFVQTNGRWSNGTALTLASGPSSGDYFGESAALSGNGITALVGAPLLANNAGAAYSFVCC
jgi:hypothetical protein